MPSWVLGALAPERRFEPPPPPPATRNSWGSAWVMTSQREGDVEWMVEEGQGECHSPETYCCGSPHRPPSSKCPPEREACGAALGLSREVGPCSAKRSVHAVCSRRAEP